MKKVICITNSRLSATVTNTTTKIIETVQMKRCSVHSHSQQQTPAITFTIVNVQLTHSTREQEMKNHIY